MKVPDGVAADHDTDDPEEGLLPLKRACALLRKHFEHVQVFAQRSAGDGATRTAQYGEGNWYARYGQVREWLLRKEDGMIHPDQGD